MAKSPAFQFYPKDFLADGNVSQMSLEEVGAYIKLLSHCWLENGIPDDIERLARMCNTTKRNMLRIWPALKPRFKKRRGMMVHMRLLAEQKKQKAYSDSRRKNAQAKQDKALTTNTRAEHMQSTENALHTPSPSADCSLFKEREGASAPRFQKPKPQELANYFEQHCRTARPELVSQSASMAEAFFDHFESNGWKVGGRGKMKDWRAAVRNFVRRQRSGGSYKANGLSRAQEFSMGTLDGVA